MIVSPASDSRPPVVFRSPVIASTSSSWPLPATPAMPKISPARTSKLTPWTTSRPRSSAAADILGHEHRLAGRALAAVDGELHVAADHELGEVLLVRLGRNARADDLAAPDDGDPVGDLEDLVQLVADEDDRRAELPGELPEDGEDLARLLRSEHGGRLVEDEDRARCGRAP